MSDRGKIRARRVTGNCQQHQREVAVAIKTSRELALLPYTQRTVSERGPGRGPRGAGGPPRGDRGPRRDDAAEVDVVAIDLGDDDSDTTLADVIDADDVVVSDEEAE